MTRGLWAFVFPLVAACGTTAGDPVALPSEHA